MFTRNDPKTGNDLWILPLEGDRKPRVLLQTPFNEMIAAISPDGRWLAYQSDESGRSEVYVQPLGDPARRWQVSIEGGSEPVWSRDGRELFFRHRDRFLAAPIQPGPAFAAGRPVVLFEGRFQRFFAHPGYDAAPDGGFIMVQRDPQSPPAPVHVVLT